MIGALLELLAGTASSGISWLAASAYHARRQRRSATTESRLICSCGHGYGTHTAEGCQADIKRPDEWSYAGAPVGYQWVRCRCKKYDGPEPLPSITWPTPLA